MSELKCPFCQQELEVMVGLSNAVLGCPKCKHIATIGVWEYIERTSKTLEAAVDAIETITATPLNSRVIHNVANKFLIDFGIEKKGGDNE